MAQKGNTLLRQRKKQDKKKTVFKWHGKLLLLRTKYYAQGGGITLCEKLTKTSLFLKRGTQSSSQGLRRGARAQLHGSGQWRIWPSLRGTPC